MSVSFCVESVMAPDESQKNVCSFLRRLINGRAVFQQSMKSHTALQEGIPDRYWRMLWTGHSYPDDGDYPQLQKSGNLVLLSLSWYHDDGALTLQKFRNLVWLFLSWYDDDRVVTVP